jgi:hypothetical protein
LGREYVPKLVAEGKNGEDLKRHAAGFGQIERTTLGIMNALYPAKRADTRLN